MTAWEKLALTVLRKADPPGELGVKALRKKVVKRAAKKQASADLTALRARLSPRPLPEPRARAGLDLPR